MCVVFFVVRVCVCVLFEFVLSRLLLLVFVLICCWFVFGVVFLVACLLCACVCCLFAFLFRIRVSCLV